MDIQTNHAPAYAATHKTIYCQRSGVPLVEVTSLCSNGWALLSQPVFTVFVHPTYNLQLGKALRKLELLLIDADQEEWVVTQSAIKEIGLTMSSIMYSLGTMWSPNKDQLDNGRNIEASLPVAAIVIGTAARLLALASWYHNETSKRIVFPQWRPSKGAGNLNWHGFGCWLDACFDIKDEWASAKRKAENKDLLTATVNAMHEVSLANVYKRIDMKKVWNWIELQASEHSDVYSAGRRETLKTLFFTGDQNPEEWLADDCDDLMMMVTDCCDIGNDITSYIRNRVATIRAGIADFYGNFTLIGAASSDTDGGLELSVVEKTAQTNLFAEYTDKLAVLTELPAKPLATDYPNKIALLRATAEWNILSKLYAMRAKRDAAI